MIHWGYRFTDTPGMVQVCDESVARDKAASDWSAEVIRLDDTTSDGWQRVPAAGPDGQVYP